MGSGLTRTVSAFGIAGFVRFLEVSCVIILQAFKTDRKISFVKERKRNISKHFNNVSSLGKTPREFYIIGCL